MWKHCEYVCMYLCICIYAIKRKKFFFQRRHVEEMRSFLNSPTNALWDTFTTVERKNLLQTVVTEV